MATLLIDTYVIIIMHNRATKVNKYILIAHGNFSSCIWQQLTDVSRNFLLCEELCLWRAAEYVIARLIAFLSLILKNPTGIKTTG